VRDRGSFIRGTWSVIKEWPLIKQKAPILKWKAPHNVKELWSFLGMAWYYRKFIKGYGVISRTMTNLLKKGVPYVWNSEKEAAFQALKQALSSTPVLALPNFSQTFVLETDACNRGIGAVLLQNGHPIAFLIRALGPKLQCLSAYEKGLSSYSHGCWQMEAIFAACRICHKNRSKELHLDDKRLSKPWQHKALTKLRPHL
jgi:hypothetical protein